MTLRGADLRFVLPHEVRHAAVVGTDRRPQLSSIAAGLEQAGIEVDKRSAGHGRGARDLIIADAGDAEEALRLPGRAHLLVGRPPSLRGLTRRSLPLLVRGDPTAPRLALPLAPTTALRHYLRLAAPRDPLPRALSRSMALLTRLPVPTRALVPSSGLLTMVLPRSDAYRPPAILQAAKRVGVRPGRDWLLRLGTGDVLQRAVFYVLNGQQPTWVVKFSRVQGYDRSFIDDAAGLAMAQTSGGPVAAHAPAHLGQFDVNGLTASVETAAVGTQLVHLLRRRPWQLLDEIADWIEQVGRHTARSRRSLEPERARLRAVVAEVGVSLGVPPDLVDRVPQTPAVLQHNDLGSWNIISDGRSFTAVDWEAARESGFPMWDLFYFAADVLAHIDGPADVPTRIDRTLRAFAGESAHSTRLFRWVRTAAAALDIPSSALGALATLCWLHHAQSPARRRLDLRGAAHAPLGHHPLLATAWLKHPGLGVSWPALNG